MRTNPAPTAPLTAAAAADAGAPAVSGTRRPRHRRKVVLAATALGLLGGIVAASPASAGTPTCKTDCVNPVVVSRKIGTAYLWHSSTVPTKGSLTLKIMGGAHVKTFTETAFSSSHSFDSGPVLQQGAWYQYLISTKDAAGNTWNESGSFQAPERTVTVTFDKVHITDDSDSGAGELSAWGRVNGTKEVKLWNEQSISAVRTMSPGKSVTISKAGSTITWEAFVQDNDVDWGEFDTSGGAPAYAVVENNLRDANVAKKSVTVSDEMGTYTVTSSQSAADRRLDFGADVSIKVTVA